MNSISSQVSGAKRGSNWRLLLVIMSAPLLSLCPSVSNIDWVHGTNTNGVVYTILPRSKHKIVILADTMIRESVFLNQ